MSSYFTFTSPDVDRVDLSVRVAALESFSSDVSTKLTQLENTKLSYQVREFPNAKGDQISSVFIDKPLLLYNQMFVGQGVSSFFISPNENKIKKLFFGNPTIGASCYFNIDLLSACGLTGLKNPYNDTDAVNKRYVDSKIPSSASQIALTPLGGISSTNVQAAIQELDQEKANASTAVTTDTQQVIKGTKIFGGNIRAGYQASIISFSPDDNRVKTLTFSNPSLGPNCVYTLNLERKAVLTNLKDPVNDYDAATKQYVDNKLSPFYAIAKSRPKLIQKVTTLLGLLDSIPESRLEIAIKALESLASSETNPSNPNFSNNT